MMRWLIMRWLDEMVYEMVDEMINDEMMDEIFTISSHHTISSSHL